MGKVFTNKFSLQNAIKTQVHLALAEVARDIFEDWYSMISDRIYKDNMLKVNPDSSYGYRRSYDILNSLELKWISPLECIIGYNTDKIRATMMASGELNRHMSIDGIDWSEALPYFVEFGNNPNGRHPIIEYEGIGAFTIILNILNTSFQSEFKKALKKRGLNVQ